MNRKLKTLGLVLASVLALVALTASNASAAFFVSAVHPQTINGSQTTSHVFTTNAGTVNCKKATFSGTTGEYIAETQTLTPDYSECTAFGFINVPVHENGCAYVFNAGGTTEVECPEGKKIEITAPFCTTTVGPQHFSSGMSYSNNAGETDIVASTNISGISYNECGTSRTNGTYTGGTTVTGASGSIQVVAAILSKSVTQNAKPVGNCEFEIAGEACEITFSVTGAPGAWVVDSNNWIGGNSEIRYNKTVKCTPPPPVAVTLKDKESCTDKIEARQIEAKTENEWCVTFKLVGSPAKGNTQCTVLKMK